MKLLDQLACNHLAETNHTWKKSACNSALKGQSNYTKNKNQQIAPWLSRKFTSLVISRCFGKMLEAYIVAMDAVI